MNAFLMMIHWNGKTVGLWGMLVLGQAMAILMKGDQESMSKYTPWGNVWGYIKAHQNTVLIRVFLANCLFMVWHTSPALLGAFGYSGPILPVNYATAGIYGVFSDKVLDWVMHKMGCSFDGPVIDPPQS